MIQDVEDQNWKKMNLIMMNLMIGLMSVCVVGDVVVIENFSNLLI